MKTAPRKTPVEALRRGLDVLEILAVAAPRRGMALGDVARSMGLKPTTTHNLLKTLLLRGYARKTAEGLYGLGWKAYSLRRAAARNLRPGGPTATALKQAADTLGEALVLAALINGHRCVLARVNVRRTVQVDLDELGRDSRPFWGLVTTRVLVAFASPEEREAVIQGEGLPSAGAWSGVHTPKALNAELDAIRAAGLAESCEDDVAAFAVPVFGGDGRMLAALGSFLPAYRYAGTARAPLLGGLRTAAASIGPVLEAEAWGESKGCGAEQGPIGSDRSDRFADCNTPNKKELLCNRTNGLLGNSNRKHGNSGPT